MAGRNVYENVELEEAKGTGGTRRALPLLPPPPPKRTYLVVSFLALLVILLATSLVVLVTLNFHQMKKLQELEVIRIYNVSLELLEEPERDLLGLILSGWKFNAGSLYFFSKENKSWQEAMEDCRSRGAQLASITSEVEKEYLLKKANKMTFWVEQTAPNEDSQQSLVYEVLPSISSSEEEASGYGQRQREVDRANCDNIRGDTGGPGEAYCSSPSRWICKKSLCAHKSTPVWPLQEDTGWDRFSSKGLQGDPWPMYTLEDHSGVIPQLNYEERESDFKHE